jgi:hypothetical protein
MILKLFLIISIITFGLWLLKARKTARVRAWQKLIVVVFVIGVITVTLSPALSTQLALFFGLNRENIRLNTFLHVNIEGIN